jgi:hypothetical protein
LNRKGDVIDSNIPDQTKDEAQTFLTMLQKLQEYNQTNTENNFDTYQSDLAIDES